MSLKNDILNELERNSSTYLSGQFMADTFNVSRNSVWKAINQLKEDGYIIESVPNRGYCLLKCSDVLSESKIESLFTSATAKKLKVKLFKTLDSTNNECKRMTAQGCSYSALVVANEQTGGRGRLGRSFYSPKNTGVYMSFIFQTDIKIVDAVSVTTAASVAVVRAIEKLSDLKPTIKWVNDVYVGDKKACGILTEAVTDFESGRAQSIVIGIGINMTTDYFPDEIKNRVASLNSLGLTRNEMIAAVADELSVLCENLSDKSYIKDYREHSFVIGKRINYFKDNIQYCANAVDIDDDGGLVVKNDDGTVDVLHSGEITVRLA